MGDYTKNADTDDLKGLSGDINPDLVRLSMAKVPNLPENIDMFTDLELDQVNAIALLRSIRDKADVSLKIIRDMEPYLSAAEREYLQERRQALHRQGLDTSKAFVGIMSICDNYERLKVSFKRQGRTEWFKVLEPKARINNNAFGAFGTGEQKKGFFDFLKGH